MQVHISNKQPNFAQANINQLEAFQQEISELKKVANLSIATMFENIKDSRNKNEAIRFQLTNDPQKPKRISQEMLSNECPSINICSCLSKEEFAHVVIDDAGSTLLQFYESRTKLDVYLLRIKKEIIAKFGDLKTKIYANIALQDLSYYFLEDYLNGMLGGEGKMEAKIDELCGYFGGNKDLLANPCKPIFKVMENFLSSMNNLLQQAEEEIKILSEEHILKSESSHKKGSLKMQKIGILSNKIFTWAPSILLKSNIPLHESISLLNEGSDIKNLETVKFFLNFDEMLQHNEPQIIKIMGEISKAELISTRVDKKNLKIVSRSFDLLPAHIFNMLKSFKWLTKIYIDLSDRKTGVSDSGIDMLSTSLKALKTIKHIKLNMSGGANSISSKGIILLSNNIQDSKFLIALQLYFKGGYNKISNKGVIPLAQSLTNRVLLKTLHLDFSEGSNKVSGEGVQAIGKSLIGLKQLVSLSLDFSGGNNEIKDGEFEVFAETLREAKSLTDLVLGFGNGLHQLRGSGILAIANVLHNLKTLNNLELNFSGLNNSIEKDSFSQCVSIYNQMNGLRKFTWNMKGNKMSFQLLQLIQSMNKQYKLYYDFRHKMDQLQTIYLFFIY